MIIRIDGNERHMTREEWLALIVHEIETTSGRPASEDELHAAGFAVSRLLGGYIPHDWWGLDASPRGPRLRGLSETLNRMQADGVLRTDGDGYTASLAIHDLRRVFFDSTRGTTAQRDIARAVGIAQSSEGVRILDADHFFDGFGPPASVR